MLCSPYLCSPYLFSLLLFIILHSSILTSLSPLVHVLFPSSRLKAPVIYSPHRAGDSDVPTTFLYRPSRDHGILPTQANHRQGTRGTEIPQCAAYPIVMRSLLVCHRLLHLLLLLLLYFIQLPGSSPFVAPEDRCTGRRMYCTEVYCKCTEGKSCVVSRSTSTTCSHALGQNNRFL